LCYRIFSAIVLMVLTLVYWYTRNNTVYISVPGTLFLAASEFSSALIHLIGIKEDLIIFDIIDTLSFLLIGYLQLRTVLRIELVTRGWIPTFRRTRSSRKERASERLDTTTWTVRLIVSLL
jgi:hypothetical protein